MDTESIIIGAVMAALCALPLVWMNASTLRRNKKLLQKLTALAQPDAAVISKHDCWSDSAIGLDESRRLLYFYRQVEDAETTCRVDLATIKACRMVKEKNDSHQIQRLELILTPTAAGAAETSLEFFNIETDLQLNRERILCELWETTLKGLISPQLIPAKTPARRRA